MNDINNHRILGCIICSIYVAGNILYAENMADFRWEALPEFKTKSPVNSMVSKFPLNPGISKFPVNSEADFSGSESSVNPRVSLLPGFRSSVNPGISKFPVNSGADFPGSKSSVNPRVSLLPGFRSFVNPKVIPLPSSESSVNPSVSLLPSSESPVNSRADPGAVHPERYLEANPLTPLDLMLKNAGKAELNQGKQLNAGGMGTILDGKFNGEDVVIKVAFQGAEDVLENEANAGNILRDAYTNIDKNTLISDVQGLNVAAIPVVYDGKVVQEKIQGTNGFDAIFGKFDEKGNSIIPPIEFFRNGFVGDPHEAVIRLGAFVLFLNSMHQTGVVHNDIKLENMMITLTGEYRVIDLGLCAKNGTKVNGCSGNGAPEVMHSWMEQHEVRRTTACDIYTFGTMIPYLLFGQYPDKQFGEDYFENRVSESTLAGFRPSQFIINCLELEKEIDGGQLAVFRSKCERHRESRIQLANVQQELTALFEELKQGVHDCICFIEAFVSFSSSNPEYQLTKAEQAELQTFQTGEAMDSIVERAKQGMESYSRAFTESTKEQILSFIEGLWEDICDRYFQFSNQSNKFRSRLAELKSQSKAIALQYKKIIKSQRFLSDQKKFQERARVFIFDQYKAMNAAMKRATGKSYPREILIRIAFMTADCLMLYPWLRPTAEQLLLGLQNMAFADWSSGSYGWMPQPEDGTEEAKIQRQFPWINPKLPKHLPRISAVH